MEMALKIAELYFQDQFGVTNYAERIRPGLALVEMLMSDWCVGGCNTHPRDALSSPTGCRNLYFEYAGCD